MSELLRLEVVKTNRFKTIDLDVIDNNPRISWKAKGIWVYLISRPPGWEFHYSDLLKRATDGGTSLRNGIKELQDQGYLLIQKIQDEKGHWVGTKWIVTEDPRQLPLPNATVVHVNRTTENRNTENPRSGKQPFSIYHSSKKHSQKETTSATARKSGKTFPKDWYNQVTESYKRIKGVEPQGREWLPIQKTIKLMFQDGRTPEQICALMEALERSPLEWTRNWTMNTVRRKMAEYLAGKLDLTGRKRPALALSGRDESYWEEM